MSSSHSDLPIYIGDLDVGLPSAEALDVINVIAATPTTERTIVVNILNPVTIARVSLVTLLTALNDTANLQKVGVTVQGRLGLGAWNNYFSQANCIGIVAVNGATTILTAVSDVTALVTANGTYGFRCEITQSGAFNVRYTIQHVLIVSQRRLS